MSERGQAQAATESVTWGRDAPGATYRARPTPAEIASGAPGTEAFRAAGTPVSDQPVIEPGDDEAGC